jgi:hypothetical protein
MCDWNMKRMMLLWVLDFFADCGFQIVHMVGSQVCGSRHAPDTSDDDDDFLSGDIGRSRQLFFLHFVLHF